MYLGHTKMSYSRRPHRAATVLSALVLSLTTAACLSMGGSVNMVGAVTVFLLISASAGQNVRVRGSPVSCSSQGKVWSVTTTPPTCWTPWPTSTPSMSADSSVSMTWPASSSRITTTPRFPSHIFVSYTNRVKALLTVRAACPRTCSVLKHVDQTLSVIWTRTY